MRPFLAFDTATDHLALALGDLDDTSRVIAARDFPAPRAANTVLTIEIEELLAASGVAAGDLAAVACGRGPGSFTGVRIGVATAKGLAHALGVGLVGFGTLDAIARRADVEGLLGVVGDAMRKEVYPALFRVHAGIVTRLTPDRVARPEEVAREWAALDEPVALAGNALAKHSEVLEGILGARSRILPARTWVPDGASIVRAAWSARGETTLGAIAGSDAEEAYRTAHPARVLPVYTRLSDAEEAERRSAERRAWAEAGER
jgi:N6-L-threonylcarbamoyladenine synthase